MPLDYLHRWQSPDSSRLLNDRLKYTSKKGVVAFEPGSAFPGQLTGSNSSLEVVVDAFVAVTADGGVVVSTTPTTLTVVTGVKSYICLRAWHRVGQSPINQLEVLTESAFNSDPQKASLVCLGVVDLSTGGPYTFVAQSKVSYTERDELDQQGRGPFRPPVANQAALPTTHNRDGDFTFTQAERALYVWNGTANAWQPYNDLGTSEHREHEHSNAITGDSVSTTLTPTVSGTDIVIADVPAESGYTVGGAYLTTRTPATIAAGAESRSSRGLIQVFADASGVLDASYRVRKDADALDINAAQVFDISDGHPTGNFTLSFNVGSLLSWGGGEPVNVATPGLYRLFLPDYRNWVDFNVTGTLPGGLANDGYVVEASASDATHMLIAYYYWGGAGGLALGADRRVFGNIGWYELSSDFRGRELLQPNLDTRGSMVFSGGAVSTISGTTVRVTGGVAYLNGQRVELPGTYNGLTLPASGTTHVYAEMANGVPTLAQGATVPAGAASLASVLTAAGAVSSITDTRSAQLNVGTTAGNSRVRFTSAAAARWVESEGKLAAEKNGSTTGVKLGSGTLYADENVVQATTGALLFRDTNTGGTPIALTSPGFTSLGGASIVAALMNQSSQSRYVRGVETGLVPSFAGLTVSLTAGALHDGYGQRRLMSGVTSVGVPSADGAYVVFWDASTASFPTAITTATGVATEDEPIAVAVVSGGTITGLTDIRRMGTGSTTEVTVGSSTTSFPTLRQALLWLSCFITKPLSIVRVTTDYTEPTVDGAFCISFAATPFAASAARLSNLIVTGPELSSATISSAVGVFDCNQVTNDWLVRNLAFTYTGTPDDSDDAITVFNGFGSGMQAEQVETSDTWTHFHTLELADGSTIDFGTSRPTVFRRCTLRCETGSSAVYASAGTGSGTVKGRMFFEQCHLLAHNVIMGAAQNHAELEIFVTGCLLTGTDGGSFAPSAFSGITIRDCRFEAGCRLDHVTDVVNCDGRNAIITFATSNRIVGCDFVSNNTTASGTFTVLRDSLIRTTGSGLVMLSSDTAYMESCLVDKFDAGTTMVTISGGTCHMTDVTLTYAGTNAGSSLMPTVAGTLNGANFTATNCRLRNVSTTTSTAGFMFTLTGLASSVHIQGGVIGNYDRGVNITNQAEDSTVTINHAEMHLKSSGQPLVLSNSGATSRSATLDSCTITAPSLSSSAIEGGDSVVVNNNKFHATVGSITLTAAASQTATFTGNTVMSRENITVTTHRALVMTLTGNSLSAAPTSPGGGGGVSGKAYLQATVSSSGTHDRCSAVVSGNTLVAVCDSNGGPAEAVIYCHGKIITNVNDSDEGDFANVSVSGNSMRAHNFAGGGAGTGVKVTDTKIISVSGNTMWSAAAGGIQSTEITAGAGWLRSAAVGNAMHPAGAITNFSQTAGNHNT